MSSPVHATSCTLIGRSDVNECSFRIGSMPVIVNFGSSAGFVHFSAVLASFATCFSWFLRLLKAR